MKTTILILLLATNCSTLPHCGINNLVWSFGSKDVECQMETFGRVSPQLIPYVEDFRDDAIYYEAACWGTNYIRLVNNFSMPGFEDTVIGLCYPHIGVEILRSYWDDATEWEKKALVYHELGHCSLGLDHIQEHGIMLPSLTPPRDEHEWVRMVEQLFKKNND